MLKKNKYRSLHPSGVYEPLPEEPGALVTLLSWGRDLLLGFLLIVVVPAILLLWAIGAGLNDDKPRCPVGSVPYLFVECSK